MNKYNKTWLLMNGDLRPWQYGTAIVDVTEYALLTNKLK